MKLIAIAIIASTASVLWAFQWEYIKDGDFRINRFTGEVQFFDDRPIRNMKYRYYPLEGS